MEPAVEIRDLSKRYNGVEALSDLTLEVRPGELIGLVGPNGAGKTTAFKCLTTLTRPSSGSIRIRGIDLAADPHRVRAFLGFLPEETPLVDELTVLEYLRYRMKLKNGSLKGGRTPDECLAICGLEERKDQRIATLSKGFRQRAGIAETLLGSPEILILDEPINGLDPDQIIHIRNLLVSLKSELTLLVSSHILSELDRICDRFAIISRGRLKAFGSRSELAASAAGKSRLVLEFHTAAPGIVSRLEALDAVESVRAFDQRDDALELLIDPLSPDPRPRIAEILKEGPTLPVTMNLIPPNLESLYLELTRE